MTSDNGGELRGRALALFARVLSVPSLWPLAIAAGHMGTEAAIAACRTRDLPPEVAALFRAGGWTAASLPPAELAERLALGARVKAAAIDDSACTPVKAARLLGVPPRDAARAAAELERILTAAALPRSLEEPFNQ